MSTCTTSNSDDRFMDVILPVRVTWLLCLIPPPTVVKLSTCVSFPSWQQNLVVRPSPMTTILRSTLILLVVLEFTNLCCHPTKLLWLGQRKAPLAVELQQPQVYQVVQPCQYLANLRGSNQAVMVLDQSVHP